MSLTNRRLTFLNKFIQSPGQVGSITPSSIYLTKKMFDHVAWDEVDAIVELGAGTGVFTNYIFEHMADATTAVIIEKDAQMRQALQETYPSFYFGSDAAGMASLLKKLHTPQVDCIISGLPFANFSPQLRSEIMSVVLECLKPDGVFIAFQYSLQMKNMLKEHFNRVAINFEMRNVPPAFVYTCFGKKEE
ncbi:hypothetical protein BEP19_13840 [Ammoniphilus oxalaticus]|uniref:Methyltransferase small domain-containing protein n=1 Tax=Ammoniphilus oxalaticus TaxID=66863 RepID=A0A419SF25_9BACL|nr:hypothetical protein BEP19_13840 [Ammoniphilus oxalaticus]